MKIWNLLKILSKIPIILCAIIAILYSYEYYDFQKQFPENTYEYDRFSPIVEFSDGKVYFSEGMPYSLKEKLRLAGIIRNCLIVGLVFGFFFLYCEYKIDPNTSFFLWIKKRVKEIQEQDEVK